ncbi:MAG: flagellar basal body-associated FliL family protein [Myxococcota bacterium]
MADDTEGEVTKVDGGGKNRLMLILMLFNLLLIAGLGAYLLLGGGQPAAAAPAPEEEEAPPPEPRAREFGPLIELMPLIANLNSPGAPRYIKVTVHLEARADEDQPIVERAIPPIRSQMLIYFSEVSAPQTDGSENKERIRRELVDAVNDVLGGTHVVDAYFTEFVVQ